MHLNKYKRMRPSRDIITFLLFLTQLYGAGKMIISIAETLFALVVQEVCAPPPLLQSATKITPSFGRLRRIRCPVRLRRNRRRNRRHHSHAPLIIPPLRYRMKNMPVSRRRRRYGLMS